MGRDVDRRSAFEELFAAHYWAVRGYVLRTASAAAEDAVAETFLVA
jgi:DNA-directed RNA polymerase specialized sigma24 family protein